jgi:hypothetical protein
MKDQQARTFTVPAHLRDAPFKPCFPVARPMLFDLGLAVTTRCETNLDKDGHVSVVVLGTLYNQIGIHRIGVYDWKAYPRLHVTFTFADGEKQTFESAVDDGNFTLMLSPASHSVALVTPPIAFQVWGSMDLGMNDWTDISSSAHSGYDPELFGF